MAANHWTLAVETHNRNLPHADHDTADISQVEPRRYPRTDILWASPECFPAGTLITTAQGQVAIEDVAIGDMVLTHAGRWRQVTRLQNQIADTVVVRGQGSVGLETTPNHRLWARPSSLVWQGRPAQYKRTYGVPDWTRADGLLDTEALWATPVHVDPLDTYDPPPDFGLDLAAAWWLVGRWVGDGSLTFGRNHEVLLTCGFHETDAIRERLADTTTRWAESTKRTATVFSIGDEKTRDWLHTHFGHGAAFKQLPTWVLSLPRAQRQALLDGYVSADGSIGRRTRVSTTSKALGITVRLLAESLGHRVSAAMDKRTTYRIEGRTGACRQQWILHGGTTPSPHRAPEAWSDDLHAWSRVRDVAPGRTAVTVYNIEVAEDHSYVADGIVVKNCTNHSQAKGVRRSDHQPDLFGETLPDEAAVRSRSTMMDVLRFAEIHRYRAIVVENVVDVRDWILWPAWVVGLDNLGYDYQVVYLNSMFAQAAGAPAPQSRDRLYVVAWRRGNRAPDLTRWTRPPAWCPSCEQVIRPIQAWKNPDRQRGRYKAQYVWRCPTSKCRHAEVYPGVLPAAAAIDWTLSGERIGDRLRPLAPKTLARIEAGLLRYARPIHIEAAMHTTASQAVACPPMVVPAGGTWNDTPQTVTEPFRTRTTRDTEALVVPVEGRENLAARPAGEPARTQTARLQDALVVPLRNNGVARPAGEAPAPTVAAAGNHHALVMRNNTGGAEMSTPTDEPLRTMTTKGHQSLVRWDHMLVPYYGTAIARRVNEPTGTVTTVDRNALVVPDIAVDDCTFRMLEPHEIQAAMAFAPSYEVLGNKRERVRQLGNAVTPPAARDLIAAVAESLT
jgi:DNA (cytosine-5)-methyltransferase 1